MELRINTKGVGGKLPNFGFVVFDDSEPVQKILFAKVSCMAIVIVLVIDKGQIMFSLHIAVNFTTFLHINPPTDFYTL